MNVDFFQAIKLFFANYVNFKGRSTRAEYWWAVLFMFICSLAAQFLGDVAAFGLNIVFFLPSLAIVVRRFHDIGRSGWWYLAMFLISIVGLVIAYLPIFNVFVDMIVNPNNLNELAVKAIVDHMGTFIGGLLLCLAVGIWAIVWCCKPSGPDNQYGPNPYGEQA